MNSSKYNSVLSVDFSLFEASHGLRLAFLPGGPAFTIAAVSKDLCFFLGIGKTSLVGQGLFEALVHNPAEREEWNTLIERVIKEKKELRMGKKEYAVDTDASSPEKLYRNASLIPVCDDQGELLYIIHEKEVVTEEEKDADRQTRFYETINGSTPDLIYVFGLDYRFTYANKALLTMWGSTWEKAIGKSLLENGYEPWHAEMHEREIDQVVATKQSVRGEVSFPHATQGRRIYDYILVPVINDKGEVEAVAGTTRDITELKQVEENIKQSEAELQQKVVERTAELEQTVKELQRSNNSLEEFAHAASHDLKEPVRKIHFFTQQLKDQLSEQLQEAELRSFSRIETATDRMAHLIDDLLLYSHVSQQPREMESVDLNQKLKRVLEDLELSIQEKNALIEIAPLPTVQGHRRQLAQLFQNLIGNALKYSKADIVPHIVITTSETEEGGQCYHTISIKDNGIGFSEEYADKIFQVFTRLHGKHEYKGTGVGLSIAKKVVENHNGFIRVKSAPGEGSVFTIYLPC